jgi:hypothetical protein
MDGLSLFVGAGWGWLVSRFSTLVSLLILPLPQSPSSCMRFFLVGFLCLFLRFLSSSCLYASDICTPRVIQMKVAAAVMMAGSDDGCDEKTTEPQSRSSGKKAACWRGMLTNN